MKLYSAQNIRNVVIAGHGGRGKTTLAEAMLFLAGAADRFGKVADGNTVMDYDPEEKRRHNSVSSAVCPVEWNGCKVNIIDTPGLFDFETGVSEGMRAADAALVVDEHALADRLEVAEHGEDAHVVGDVGGVEAHQA